MCTLPPHSVLLSAAKASCTARLLQEGLDATVPGPLFLLGLRALYLARGFQGPRIVGGAVPGQTGMHVYRFVGPQA